MREARTSCSQPLACFPWLALVISSITWITAHSQSLHLAQDGSTGSSSSSRSSGRPSRHWLPIDSASAILLSSFNAQLPAYSAPRCTPLAQFASSKPCLRGAGPGGGEGDAGVRVCANDLLVLSTSSIQRAQDAEAQQATLGRHALILRTNETLYPRCFVCDGVADLPAPDQLFPMYTRTPRMGSRWLCAQQRFVLGLADALLMLRDAAALPAWLLMVDDDTSVHMPALAGLLASLDPGQSLYLGRANWGKQHMVLEFAEGGAGYALSGALLRQLVKPVLSHASYTLSESGDGHWVEADAVKESAIEQCRHAVALGGSLCYGHSDWVIGQCVHAASGHRMMPERKRELWAAFSQRACDGSNESSLITCHHMHAKEQVARYTRIVEASCKQQQ